MFLSVPKRSSSFIKDVKVNLRYGKVVAYFQDGNVYGYRNVSKRAILNLLMNPSISLGYWCNKNLFKSSRVREDWRVIPQPKKEAVELPYFI